MSEAVFERRARIEAAPDAVFAFLREPENLIALQPFSAEVRAVPARDAAYPDQYEVSERVPILGGWHVTNRITVRVAVQPEDRIVRVRTTSAPRIELRAELRAEPELQVTRLRERVKLTCPGALKSFVLRRAIQAQEGLLQRAKQRIEAEAGCRRL